MPTDPDGSELGDRHDNVVLVYSCEHGHEQKFPEPREFVEEQAAYFHSDPCQVCALGPEPREEVTVRLQRIEGLGAGYERDGSGVRVLD